MNFQAAVQLLLVVLVRDIHCIFLCLQTGTMVYLTLIMIDRIQLYKVRQASFLFYIAIAIQKRKLACRTLYKA
jgi:hypothetical protein